MDKNKPKIEEEEYSILYDLIDSFLKEDVNKQNYDQFYEDLKNKTINFEKKDIELNGKELLNYAFSLIKLNPFELNSKNIYIKLKIKLNENKDTKFYKSYKLLFDFLFSINDNNQEKQMIFQDKNINDKNYSLINFRDDVIYYICNSIGNEEMIDHQNVISQIIYSILRISKNIFSKPFFIFILILTKLFEKNVFFFVENLFICMNEKNESYLINNLNLLLKKKNIKRQFEKISYSNKGIKEIKNIFLEFIKDEKTEKINKITTNIE